MTDPTAPSKAKKASAGAGSSMRNSVEWVLILVVAILAAILIKTFLFQAFRIPSASMVPTLKNKDRVLVNKVSYHMHDVHRGDIIVFKRPPAEQGGDPLIKDLIKRVIGRPGETVDIADGHVLVDGRVLNEPYLHNDVVTATVGTVALPLKLGPDEYWVMGDNRTDSKDSRFFGAISRKLVVGRAFVRVWPFSRIAFL